MIDVLRKVWEISEDKASKEIKRVLDSKPLACKIVGSFKMHQSIRMTELVALKLVKECGKINVYFFIWSFWGFNRWFYRGCEWLNWLYCGLILSLVLIRLGLISIRSIIKEIRHRPIVIINRYSSVCGIHLSFICFTWRVGVILLGIYYDCLVLIRLGCIFSLSRVGYFCFIWRGNIGRVDCCGWIFCVVYLIWRNYWVYMSLVAFCYCRICFLSLISFIRLIWQNSLILWYNIRLINCLISRRNICSLIGVTVFAENWIRSICICGLISIWTVWIINLRHYLICRIRTICLFID